jgi:hypothetical protein
MKEIDSLVTLGPLPYPYSLTDSRPIKNGIEWEVKEDASGIYWSKGKLRIKKINGTISVDAPNDTIKSYVIDTLKLNPPTRQ